MNKSDLLIVHDLGPEFEQHLINRGNDSVYSTFYSGGIAYKKVRKFDKNSEVAILSLQYNSHTGMSDAAKLVIHNPPTVIIMISSAAAISSDLERGDALIANNIYRLTTTLNEPTVEISRPQNNTRYLVNWLFKTNSNNTQKNAKAQNTRMIFGDAISTHFIFDSHKNYKSIPELKNCKTISSSTLISDFAEAISDISKSIIITILYVADSANSSKTSLERTQSTPSRKQKIKRFAAFALGLCEKTLHSEYVHDNRRDEDIEILSSDSKYALELKKSLSYLTNSKIKIKQMI